VIGVLPPRPVRRIVLAPLVVALAVALLVLFPLLGLVLGALGLARSGRLRAFRLLCFGLIWLLAETAALFMCLGLWIASGFGGRKLRDEPYRRRHYAVMRWFLDLLYRGATRTLGLRVAVTQPDLDATEAAARLARPVIILSRHAGPGDSFLLVHQLLSVYGRRPRVVMKAALQLDPGVDVVGNRLPNVFVQQHRAGDGLFSSQISRLATDLGNQDALVIFPEGGNWTPGRWRRGIRRLEVAGRQDLARRARRMPNLLPPRTGGTLAAIAACPDADVIFVAHAGLDRLVSISDVWRHLPIEQTLEARWWRVQWDDVPRAAPHEDQVQWLYGWWERIDAWISEHRTLALSAGPAAEREWGCFAVGVAVRTNGGY
jgi:1-acyl-sn-glycerol-3-phosphate acyltransferase